MDQQKIGRFIALCRKEQRLTQAQLAEKLNVTDKAVSKWETGRGLPDVSLYRELCSILGISLNEFFAGERIPAEEIETRSEENLLTVAADAQRERRRTLQGSILCGTGLGMLLVALAVLEKFARPLTAVKLIWLILALTFVLLGLRGCSFRREKMKTVRIVFLVLLTTSALAAADLGINYFYNLLHEYHDGITICGFMPLLLYGDDLWSLEGFFEQFKRMTTLTMVLIVGNAALQCAAMASEKRI